MFGSEVAFLLSVYICVNIEEVLGVAAITCLRIEFSSAAIDIIQEALLEFSVGLYYPTLPHPPKGNPHVLSPPNLREGKEGSSWNTALPLGLWPELR